MKLTPSQALLLNAAAIHPQHVLTDFPPNLKGGALIKVLTSLGNEGLIRPHSKGAAGSTRFAITVAGLQAIATARRLGGIGRGSLQHLQQRSCHSNRGLHFSKAYFLKRLHGSFSLMV